MMDSLTFLLLTNILLTLATAQDTKTARFCERDHHRTSSLSCTEASTVIDILNVTVAYTYGAETCDEPKSCPFHQAAANNTFTHYVLSTCSAQPNCSLNISYLKNESFFTCGHGHGSRNTAEIEYTCCPSAVTSNLMPSPRTDITEGNAASAVTTTVSSQEPPIEVIIPVLCCLLTAAVILVIALVIRKRRKQSKSPKAAIGRDSKEKRLDISNGESHLNGVVNQRKTEIGPFYQVRSIQAGFAGGCYSAVIPSNENEKEMSAVPHSTTTESYYSIPEFLAPSAQPEFVYNQVKRSKDDVYVNTVAKGESQGYYSAEFYEGISSWNSVPTYDLPFESDSQGVEHPSTLALHSKVNERLVESIPLTDNPLYVASPV